MSRIGNNPVALPEKVEVTINGNEIGVKGPKGKLQLAHHALVLVEKDGSTLHVKRVNESSQAKSMHGVTRTLIANMVHGVTHGFERQLEINGVGYRAELKGHALNLSLGYSHPIVYPLPAGVTALVDDKRTKVSLTGINKQQLGVVAAEIRSFRPPEPYGGKGIKYPEEVIVRKEGKSAGK